MIIQGTPVSSATPFNLPDVVDHVRVDDSDAAELKRLSHAAAREFEDYAQIALLDQTVSVTIDDPIRSAMLALPIAPLVDPLSVEITVDGVAFDACAVIAGLRPAIRFTEDKPCGFVVIIHLAGFGATSAAIPDDVKHAVADQALAYLGERGVGDGKSNGMSPHMARIAARYRRVAL